MVNSNKLKGKMRELQITQLDVAKALSISPPTVSQKLNNVRDFNLEEAEKLSNMLHIETGEFGDYFFAH